MKLFVMKIHPKKKQQLLTSKKTQIKNEFVQKKTKNKFLQYLQSMNQHKLIKKIFNMLDTQMIKNKIKKFLKNPIQKIDNQEQEEEKNYVKEVKVNQTGELLKTI